MASPARQPTYFIPHGAGPCFFMDWQPEDEWKATAEWLGSIGRGEDIRAILVISAHWQEHGFAVTAAAHPSLIYDYYGFPRHTYALTYEAPGDPALAGRIVALLEQAGLPARRDETRGFDHGVFVPLKLIRPEADLPVVQLSLEAGLDPARHLALGRALAPLRDEGVLIVGSGMSFHNMGGFSNPAFTGVSERFDAWLEQTVSAPAARREEGLIHWAEAPGGRLSHPYEEHLIPLMVAAGAAGEEPGQVVFRDQVMQVTISGVRFGVRSL